MKNSIKIFHLSLCFILMSGCGSYLDENIDPYRAQTISLDALLPTTIDATSNNHYLVAVTTGMFSQHLASYFAGGSDSYQETRMPTAWTGIYLSALSNLDILVEQAQQQESPHYAGIAKILQAMNLCLATDVWGDVPFSDAFQGAKDVTPSFDDQSDVYTAINTLLDESIALLQHTNSLFKPAADDLVYGGNVSKWIKLAYSLKARFAIHETKKDPTTSAQDALNALALAINANADDFQLVYNSVNRNPWFNNVASPLTTGNFTVGPSEQLINLMNGTYYTAVDPRLSKLVDNQGAAMYSGNVNGQGGGGNSRLSANTWYAGQLSPMLMVTFAEMKFIEAEAHFIVGNKLGAYNAYLAGINAHMQKLGVAASAITTYTTSPSVAVGSGNITLELIMKEKYIATFLNPEAWVDVRRHAYNENIYRGMSKPVNYNEALGGEFIRRCLYPNEEITRNAAEVTPHVKLMQEKMWWEQ
ncbi:MAG TPA: SusD/RagB family nutrient-binding outer membrane lipoprotein [Chryseosolibacter sp.]